MLSPPPPSPLLFHLLLPGEKALCTAALLHSLCDEALGCCADVWNAYMKSPCRTPSQWQALVKATLKLLTAAEQEENVLPLLRSSPQGPCLRIPGHRRLLEKAGSSLPASYY